MAPTLTTSAPPSTSTFNVGGQHFATHLDTLLKEPACRLAHIARSVISCPKDDAGAFVVDRCGKNGMGLHWGAWNYMGT